MFALVFAIGIFSYLVFFLGMIGLIYSPILISTTIVYWLGFFILFRKSLLAPLQQFKFARWSLLFGLGVGYVVLQAVVNFVGLLGPEIGFDATWYHLMLPKLYLVYHYVLHIPGGILYYSDMPKLTEMLYTVGLALGSDFWARLIHFSFGILTVLAIYKVGRKFFSANWAILLSVIFLSNLVVGWESISAYIDLSRTFFSVMALWAFLNWTENKERKWLLASGLLVGLTVTTKLLALGDVALYAIALYFVEQKSQRLSTVMIFVLLALLVPLPWFAFSFVHTGNPLYPLFSSLGMPTDTLQIANPLYLLTTLWNTFARASDPIHPIFLAIIPFIILSWKKLKQDYPIILWLSLGSLFIWYITPQTGGGRYVLPYLPLFSLLTLITIKNLSLQWQKIFIAFIFTVAGISLIFRGIANEKFLPVIAGKETKAQFMTKHLQFNLGDFYDIDGYFASHIKSTDKVLLYGFHNLYYVAFPYVDNSWVQKGDRFNYVAVQGNGMPDRFRYWHLVYYNTTTQVRLYSFKGQTWVY